MNSTIVLPDMLSKFCFQVHYGDYYISHDAYGVDLSAFERREEFWVHMQMASRDIQCESKDSFPIRSDCDELGN